MNTADLKNINRFFRISQTRNGVQFDPNEDIWNITDSNKHVLFTFNRLNLRNKHIYSLKIAFKWYLENRSLTHSHNMFEQLVALCSYLYNSSNKTIEKISDIDIINYREFIGKDREYILGALSGFLKHWYKMGDSFLTKEAYGYLKEATFKGNKKGEAVMTMDPYEGPYTDLELNSIQMSINNAYAEDKISTADYIIVWLLMIYSSRPIQLAQHKVKDVIAVKLEDGSYETFLNIPRVKNRKEVRTEFKKRIVPKSFASILVIYSQQIITYARGVFPNAKEAPLFLGNKAIDYNEDAYDMEYHLTSAEVSGRINKVINKLKIKSERTNNFIKVTPYRFRRTFGTRMATEGHGVRKISEALDHSDTQNAMVYIEGRPEMVERIDRAMAINMAPIAQAFAGVIVKDKSKAIRANDPKADIINPSVDKTCTPAGKCGSHSFCGQMSPLACYTCSSFQAWDDGPHEAVLEHLLRERERLKESTDLRIASINDKTILAVAQVIAACQKNKDKNDIKVIIDVSN
jgi:integrase